MKDNFIRGRLPIIIALVIIGLTAIGVWRRCSNSSSTLTNDYVRPYGDTLAVAIEMSPLTYTLHNDTAEGFDYEILRNITSEHGVKVKFYPISDLKTAFQGLYDGDYDLLVASMPSTKALKKFFPLTDAVYTDKQVLVQRMDSLNERYIASQEQLMGDTVWITEGSPVGTRLANMTKELGESIYVATKKGYSAEHLAITTALGETPRAVVNESVARRIAADYPALDISTPISLNQFQCWAVAPGDSTLLDSLNFWLGQYKNTESFRHLAEQYLGY